MEDSDTLFLPQPSGGPLTVIPNSTRATLLSTVSAKRLKAAGSKNRKLHHDAMAAAVVLQSYLDEAR